MCNKSQQKRFWLIFFCTAFVLTLLVFATKDFAILLIALLMYLKQKVKPIQSKLTGLRGKTISKDDIDRDRFQSRIKYNNNRITNDLIIKKEAPRRFIFSAVLQITLSFFQIASLLMVKSQTSDKQQQKLIDRIISLFNLEVTVKEAQGLCPFQSVNILWVNFIKKVAFVLTMLAFVLLSACMFLFVKGFRYIRSRFSKESERTETVALDSVQIDTSKSPLEMSDTNPPLQTPTATRKNTMSNEYFKGLFRLSFLDKLILSYAKILMFGYKNISLFTIVSLNCVEMDGESVLYISAQVKCYQTWQWWVVALLVLWVIPFPIALVQAYRLYDKGYVSRFWYVICLAFPLLIIALTIKVHGQKSRLLHEREGLQAALYDQFEEPYRIVRRKDVSNDTVQYTLYWWSAWRLYERLLVAGLVTFLIEPLFRMCVVAPIIVLLSILHYQIEPYKKTMPLLSLLDMSSYVFLTFFVVDSMFRSFAYTFDLPLQNPIDKGIKTLDVFQAFLTPLTVLCLFIVTLLLEALYEVTKTISKKTD